MVVRVFGECLDEADDLLGASLRASFTRSDTERDVSFAFNRMALCSPGSKYAVALLVAVAMALPPRLVSNDSIIAT